MFYTVTTLLLAILGAVFVYYKWKFQYWKKRGLPVLEPSIPFGHLQSPISATAPIGDVLREYYKIMKRRGNKHAGIYFLSSPAYFPIDLDYVKNILTTDFAHFVNRGILYDEEGDPLSAHLFALDGGKWRNLRVKLTPTFTSGKMKMMFNTLVECGKIFKTSLDGRVVKGEALDIKELLSCFTTDIIGSCAFGLECNSIVDQNSPFRQTVRKFFNRTTIELLQDMLKRSFPRVTKMLHCRILPKDVTDFYMDIVKKTVDYREKNDINRNDFLQILINLKNRKFDDEIKEQHDGKSLTIEEVAAQCFVFFLAGFETSSTLMTFALTELCLNPDIQSKLRDETEKVLRRHNGEISYESLMDMKYMDQVINETLRKYPPVPMLNRQCVKDYKVPGTDLVIEKGIKCFISVMGIHYYPEPELFDPERFNEENKNSRHQYAHLPFGEGPRNCIGMRFGLMQAKMGLTILLKNYKFTLHPKTKVPIKLEATKFIPTVEGGVWLQGERV